MSLLRSAVTLQDPRLSSTARLLQIVLAGHAKDGEVTMTQRHMLALTNLDPRTARKGINALQDMGYLVHTGNSGSTPVFDVVFPKPTKENKA